MADAAVVWRRFDEGCSVRILHPQRFCDPLWHLVSLGGRLRRLWQLSRCWLRLPLLSVQDLLPAASDYGRPSFPPACLPACLESQHPTPSPFVCSSAVGTPSPHLTTVPPARAPAGGPPGELPAVPRRLQLVPHPSRHAGLCAALVGPGAALPACRLHSWAAMLGPAGRPCS